MKHLLFSPEIDAGGGNSSPVEAGENARDMANIINDDDQTIDLDPSRNVDQSLEEASIEAAPGKNPDDEGLTLTRQFPEENETPQQLDRGHSTGAYTDIGAGRSSATRSTSRGSTRSGSTSSESPSSKEQTGSKTEVHRDSKHPSKQPH